MTIDEYVSKVRFFTNDPFNISLFLSNFHFHSFFEYEGHNIPIYTYYTYKDLCLLSSSCQVGLFSLFIYFYHFSTVDQLRDFLILNSIHIGSHDNNIYFYQELNQNREDFGYFSIIPSPSQVGSFGFSSSIYSDYLFDGANYSYNFAMSSSFDSLFDHRLLFPTNYEYYFFRLNSMEYDKYVPSFGDYGDVYNYTILMRFFGYVLYPNCCYPDFAPILRTLGGVPVTDQSQNLKMICQLLGVDTNTTLDNCEAIKEYLRRIVQVLGGFPQNEPNDNLKIICDLLGVDSNSNGLSDCDLSKDYVKRISKMLGAE